MVITGRKQETLDPVARELGPGAKAVACHAGKADQLNHLVDSTIAEFRRIDILVNNAATNIAQGPCLEMDEGQFDKMVEINLKSTFRQVRNLMELEKKYPEGKELNHLTETVSQFRDDELEHRDIALEKDAEKATGYPVLEAVIGGGCRAAIWISERI